MAKTRKVSAKDKRKKKWFAVLAPKIFGERNLPDIVAFEPKELIGRKIEISLKIFTASPRDALKRVVCKIVKVEGDTAHTEACRFFIADNYIQRVSKRSKSRVLKIHTAKTKDGKTAKLKLYTLITNKVKRDIKTTISKYMVDTVSREVSKATSQEIFSPKFIDSVFADKKHINKVYPIAKMLIWKISLVE